MRAYVLIDAPLENARRIVLELQRKPGILLADIVSGPHPVIAVLEGGDPSSVAQNILFDIRKIEGVTDLTVYIELGTKQKRSTSVRPGKPSSVSPSKSRAATDHVINNLRQKRARRPKVEQA